MRIVLVMILVLLTTQVFAVDIVNRDKRSYNVRWNDAGTQHSETIKKRGTISSACSECTIYVSGLGSVKAVGSENVVIENGRLSVE